jgi:hypothetical protein
MRKCFQMAFKATAGSSTDTKHECPEVALLSILYYLSLLPKMLAVDGRMTSQAFILNLAKLDVCSHLTWPRSILAVVAKRSPRATLFAILARRSKSIEKSHRHHGANCAQAQPVPVYGSHIAKRQLTKNS